MATSDEVKQYLIGVDPNMRIVFDAVGTLNFSDLMKPVYVALIGAILGQKIPYREAKELRGRLYTQCGTDFGISNIDPLLSSDFFPSQPRQIIFNLNTFLKNNNIDVNTCDLDCLLNVVGIGPWTIVVTKLTSFRSWDLFPPEDLFLRKRLQKLYSLERMPSIEEARLLAVKWSPYRSFVTWYLWRWF